MNENENVGFEDFEGALFGDDYQFDDDGEDEAPDTDDTEDGNVLDDSAEDEDSDDDEDAASDDDEDDSETEDSEEADADEEDPAEDTDGGQTFTLKVNKEEKKVTLEEMTALAQKGADYDRVKEQNTKSQQTIQDLQAQLEGFNGRKNVLDMLDIISAKSGKSADELMESIYLSVRKSAGVSEETAREELKSAKLEKELNGYKAKQEAKPKENDAQTRANRELEEFRQNFPDVALSEELVQKLVPDVQKGMSLSAAYRKLEKAQADARIRDLEQQLAAKKQNDKNKKRSPGSQKDSGGRRTRSDYEEFERALFG
jgi:hypothetical protein